MRHSPPDKLLQQVCYVPSAYAFVAAEGGKNCVQDRLQAKRLQMLEVAEPRKAAAIQTRHDFSKIDDWSTSWRGRPAILQAWSARLTALKWILWVRYERAMTVDDLLVVLRIHFDVEECEEDSNEEAVKAAAEHTRRG